MKYCPRCKTNKAESDFYNNKSKKDGLSRWCKVCTKLDCVSRQQKYIKFYNGCNIDKKICSDCGKEKHCFEFGKDMHQKTGIKCHCLECDRKRQKRDYYKNGNLTKIKTRLKTIKRFSSPQNRLYNSIKVGIYKYIKDNKGGRSWPSLLPYSFKEFCDHLEKQFHPGMTWENYGKWHVDHKIPISAFNVTCAEDIDFKRGWALNNLQPLWAKENLSKNDKINGEFQPCLNLKF